jgi:hypothetical protein
MRKLFKLCGNKSLLRRSSDVCQQDAGVPFAAKYFKLFLFTRLTAEH